MRTMLLASAIVLAACQPLPPCEDEACVQNRQAVALMWLGAMQQQQEQQQQQQQLQDTIQDAVHNSLSGATVYMYPNSNEGYIGY